jgi:predicted DNA-binding protein (MmcQ/YjbR family)
MTLEDVAEIALRLPETVQDEPFGPDIDVYKVAGRIFVFRVLDTVRPRIALKCDPDLASLLRGQYAAVTPGHHLNKRHWNSVALDGSIPEDALWEMIQHSYERVIAKLPKATRARIAHELDSRTG